MIPAELVERTKQMVAGARRLADTAAARVESGEVCDSWFFGDEAACIALRGNAQKLRDEVRGLEGVLLLRNWTQATVEFVSTRVELIASEAENLLESTDVFAWATYARDVVRDLAAAIAAGVEGVVNLGLGAVGGLLDGLGPIGSLALVAVLYLYVTRGR